MVESCPSCHGGKIKLIGKIPSTNNFAGNTYSELLPGGQLYACSSCHLYFRNPIPSKEIFSNLYSIGNELVWAAKEESRVDWLLAADKIKDCVAEGDVLDVGCFDGGFLDLLPERYNRFGIEIHPSAIKKAQSRRVSILGNDFYQLERLNRKFDAVVAIDVIEHHSDPREFLRSLEKITRPGGIVIVATGNAEALSWRLLKSRYWYCTIAEHVSFISPKWCSAAPMPNNFRLQSIDEYSHSIFANSWKVRIGEAIKNILYAFFPGVSRFLRKRGLGGKDVRLLPELADHPPTWLSARDHFMVTYRKYENISDQLV